MVEDKLRDLNSMTFSIFQIYFYDNLFNLGENSKIQNQKRLNKRTIETLLNKFYVLDDTETNEATIKHYANEKNITIQLFLVAKIINGFLKAVNYFRK